MLSGRLGLDGGKVRHGDRHGLVWLARGTLSVESGSLRFLCTGSSLMPPGDYAVPVQSVSMVLLGPGTTVTHDAMRLTARQGTGMIAVGEDGVRCYSAPPLGRDDSALARRQAMVWADADGTRRDIARRMYALRFGSVLPHRDIAVLRGIEGRRMKEVYSRAAQEAGIRWHGRRYDRADPGAADLPNQALNHASSAVESAAMIAVSAVSAIPQLGFIHEDSAASFVLDIADLYRESITVPVAFAAARRVQERPSLCIEREVRMACGEAFHKGDVIGSMIDRIKGLFDVDDCHYRA